MIYNVYLIRHAKTQSNFEGRYTGVTDEPLHEAGSKMLVEKIKAGYYPEADQVYVSPMIRCRQTAEMIYPNLSLEAVPGFAEYNFGDFEGSNYQELKDNLSYRKWVESGGTERAPGGEDILSYKKRCCQAFEQVLDEIRQRKIRNTALVIHGGTIMAILEKYVPSDNGFYGWQVKNCEGYKLAVIEELWKKEKMIKHYQHLNYNLISFDNSYRGEILLP